MKKKELEGVTFHPKITSKKSVKEYVPVSQQ
jgi:hypothetical protein